VSADDLPAGTWRWFAILAVVSALLLAFVSFRAPGPELDEGVLVSYPTLVSQGEVPWADFESFSGPGEDYLVAGAVEVFGASVDTERAVGGLLRVGLVLAIFWLALPWGIVTALAAGGVALLSGIALGISAIPLPDAVALIAISLALLSTAQRRRSGGRSAAAHDVLGGGVAALALAFRPDFVFAVALATGPFFIAADGRGRLRTLAGFGVGLLPTVVWALVVGPNQIGHVLGDLFETQPGRRLPLPGPSDVEGQVLVASFIAIVATLMTAVILRRRAGSSIRVTTLFALGLFAVGLLPPTIERADAAHLLVLATVALAAVPLVITEAVRAVWPDLRVVAGVAAAIGAVAVIHSAGPAIANRVRGIDDAAYSVTVGDRSFPIASQAAAEDLNKVLGELEEVATPGDSLFVGTADLTRTNYNDAFVYFLFPDLRPASYFTEFNPQTANADDSPLASELADADFIVRTTRWDDWNEPNESDRRGPAAPDEVVANDFRPIAAHGTYELLQRRAGA
jgi:hypothetical protein